MWQEVMDDEISSQSKPKTRFACFDEHQVEALAQAMPDAQSAVLLCLAWQAARQSRLRLGDHAGHFVARLSGRELAVMTGYALRTIRYALKALSRRALISLEEHGAGKKSAYRLNLTPFTLDDDVSGSA